MTYDRRRAFILLAAGLVIVSGFFAFATVGVGEVTGHRSAAIAPGLPPHDPYIDPIPPTTDFCGPTGEIHEYYGDRPKETPNSQGPSFPLEASDEQLKDELYVRLCDPDANRGGSDRLLGRAIEAAAWPDLDPNRPFSDGWLEHQRGIVGSIDWNSVRVKKNVMSTPGVWSTYMYADRDGVVRIGAVEVKPRLSTYMEIDVITGVDTVVTLKLRLECGAQVEFGARDQVPTSLLL